MLYWQLCHNDILKRQLTTTHLYLLVILSARKRFFTSFESCIVKFGLTLIPLMWRIWWAPNNARKWQMGFNSAFKGLKQSLEFCNESVSVSSIEVLTHSCSSSVLLLSDYVLNYSYILVSLWFYSFQLSVYLCYLPHIICVVSSKRMIWAEHVECTAGEEHYVGFWWGNLKT